MPNRDRTGPQGQGPLTGRGLGPCTNRAGLQRGFGRGFGRRFSAQNAAAPVAQITKAEEKKLLEQELDAIEQEKQEIKKRLKEIKA